MTALTRVGAAALLGASIALCFVADGYELYVIASVGLTAMAGIGLNVLLGLTGQVSVGHVGFYAIGAYAAAILTTTLAVSFWLALPAAIAIASAVGALLAIPALRVSGPYLAMVTIAFGFIIEHGATEWRVLTGGANGMMNIPQPAAFAFEFGDREVTVLIVVLTAAAVMLFRRLSASAWGQAMRAVRDSEVAAQSLGLDPVIIRSAAFVLSAAAAGAAGALFAPLATFVSPSSFSFYQSIMLLLVVMVGGAGTVWGPVIGAAVVVLLPELLSALAEYRLLFFGALLFLVLRLAPGGIVGLVAGWLPRRAAPQRRAAAIDAATFIRRDAGGSLAVEDLEIAFGGLRAVAGVGFEALPGAITSLIGPNGAGKTTVLNLICGFYRPTGGAVRLDGRDLAGLASHRVARAGLARTYQTTQLFGAMSVIDNLIVAQHRGRPGSLLAALARAPDHAEKEAVARGLLAFVGYEGPLDQGCAALAHVDKRLVEIARALAIRPRVLLLDEPAAGLGEADTQRLAALLRRIADAGIAVVLVEHDMTLVMGVSDHVVVLDAGRCIAAGPPAAVRNDPAVRKDYLGEDRFAAPARPAPRPDRAPEVLAAARLSAGYGAAPVLAEVALRVEEGELVAILGPNGAGKTTLMRALSGLHRPVGGAVTLRGRSIAAWPAHRIVASGLVLVPEGRQVFPELSVLDNIRLGAFARADFDEGVEVERVLARFPALRARLHNRAGLLSGGEQQMLAIARGLVARPRILLLDEPSLGLAPGLVRQLFVVLTELRDEGMTILLVDQVAALALAVADRGYVIEAGRIVAAGTAGAHEDAALERAYFGGVDAAAGSA